MAPKQLVLATDLSCRGDRALDRAVALAVEWNARLVVVHAIEAPLPVSDIPSWRRTIDPREAAIHQLQADLRAPDALDRELIVERGEPAPLVLDIAARRGAELIITGVARDETLGRALLGTTIDTLARCATVPVLVVKSRPRGPYRNVMVASDFSDHSRTALVAALELYPAALISLFHAYQVIYEGLIDDKMAVREAMEQEAQVEAREFLATTPIPEGRHISTLCEYGQIEALLGDLMQTAGVDLVVAGTRGRGRVTTLLLGSVAKALLMRLPGDVMIVPRAE